MNVILIENKEAQNLYPLTFTKPIGELRMGILTFKERWDKLLGTNTSYFIDSAYLTQKYTARLQTENHYIHPSFLPTNSLVEKIKTLQLGEVIFFEDQLVAGFLLHEDYLEKKYKNTIVWTEDLIQIKQTWHLFQYNDLALNFDFELMTKGRTSQPISSTNGVIQPENIFLEEGAKVEYAILNASKGVIYIGKNAEIMEGVLVRGGLALCENSTLNMGAKIYGATTIGPWCKVGGEVNNSILTAYSSKGHEGFLGNSVLGEWCNLGADTNNSNLKNNYAEVKLWNYPQEKFIKTGLQFCGLIMGDHSKSAINTQFNTGTVVGVSSSIFEAGFPPNCISSFSWGGKKDAERYNFEKAMEVAQKVMERRNQILSEDDKAILKYCYLNHK